MATQGSKVANSKLSFASVAAMVPPARSTQIASKSGEKSKLFGTVTPASLVRSVPESRTPSKPHQEVERKLSHLDIKDDVATAPNASEHTASSALPSGSKFDEERIHRTSTKPPSLDGKSVASGTTFAMDEKESLRPDDSASIKAAEEDDSNSGPLSGGTSSRLGSEAGGKAFRDQFSEISERMSSNGPRLSLIERKTVPGIVDAVPQGSLSSPPPTLHKLPTMLRPEILVSNGSPLIYKYQEPHEKLIEAMESPKDRLFILQLELQIISFINGSEELVMDLPPCNSFCRLLAHKLADYYALTHYVDNAVSAVRLYRTPYCRVRSTPLSAFSKQSSNSDGTSAAPPSMKIMRRAGIGTEVQNGESGATTTASSLGPSNANSETGDDSQRVTGLASPTESATAKDKSSMTREEREAQYKEARQRIFKGVEESENPDSTQGIEVPKEESRTSSTTGKKKTKKKQINNDDGFTARSSYNAYYPEAHYAGVSFCPSLNNTTYYNPYTQQANVHVSQPGIPSTFQQSYPKMPSYQGYQAQPLQPTINGGSNPYLPNTIPTSFGSYRQQMPQQFFQPIPSQAPVMSSPALSNSSHLSRSQQQIPEQRWSPNGYASPYQNFVGQQLPYQTPLQPQIQGATSTLGVPAISYPYGQLPYQPNSPGCRSPHPLPGSYNRQAFNPNSRDFVPGNGFLPSHSAGYGQMLGDCSSFRPSANFGPASYGQQQANTVALNQPPRILPYAQAHTAQPYTPRKNSGQTSRSQSPGQSSLSKWATPANLPPKPPPSEAASKPNLANNHNGQGMPTFVNGTYSKPSTS